MKVILKEDVKDLGTMGAIVDVSKGYGRNYLLPRNLAVEANEKNVRQFEHQKNMILAKAKKIRKTAEDLAESVSKLVLTFERQAGEEDRLFGSVTTKDIAGAIAEKGFEIDRRKISLDEAIKRLGTYDVQIRLEQDVLATVRIEVVKTETPEA